MKKIIPLLSVFMLLFMACPPKDGEEVAITLSPTTLELKVGETGALTASVTPAQAKIAGVKWSSSNTAVASVSSGTVTGVGEGTATITAESVQDPSKKASASVTVTNPYKDGFTISGENVIVLLATQKKVNFQLFSDSEKFLNEVKACFPAAESAGFTYSNIIVKKIDAAENSLVLLTDPPLFKLDSPLSADSFAGEKTANVQPGTEYTKKFALDLEVGGRTVKVTWGDGEGDVFTTPSEGEITFSASDVSYSVSADGILSGSVNNLLTKFTDAGIENVESKQVKITVTANDQTKDVTSNVSNSIEWSFDKAFDEGTDVELNVKLTFDGWDPMPNVTYEGLPIVFTTAKSVTVTPAEINLLRKTDDRGNPEATLIAQFSYPDMEVLLDGADYLNGAYADYDFENATWSAEFADADNAGTPVATITDAPYGEPTETNLALDKDYNLKLIKGTLTVPARVGGTSVSFSLVWGSDKLFGDSVLVKGDREFPEYIWLDQNGNYKEEDPNDESYTKYRLSWGDDFNYPFNGLNYKNNGAYLAARENPDDPAHDFARLWGCEKLEQGSHGRKSGTWDFRTIEAKNGMLMSKHMAADADNDIFYLGLNKTKPLGGFTDINQDGQSGHTFVPNFISGAAVTNELYGKGYYVAKLRTRYKGYSDTKHFTGGEAGGTGAWFAFWMHGPVHEFDLMEQTAGSPRVINYVNQYHNSWGTYGTTYMSYFYQQLNVNGADTVMQDNWYKLALQWTDDQVTYYYNDVWAHYYKATDSNNKQASLTKNNNLQSQAGAVSNNGNTDKQSVNTSGFNTSYRDHGYTDTLLAVPQAPMNVFLSTEIGSGWGSVPTQKNALNHLPVWVEADYIAYYVPDVPVQSVEIPEDLKLQYETVYLTTPDFQLTAEVLPSNATSTEVSWSSSDDEVLTVSADGIVHILKAGEATVTVASVLDSSKSDSFLITVNSDSTPVESVEINTVDETVAIDYMGTTTLTVTILPDNASVKNVEWTVAPEGIVELENADTETVTVNAVGSGTATITVTSVDNPEAVDSVSVTIAPPTAPGTFEAHGTTFTKVDSLEFSGDNGALPDYAVVEEVDGGEGRITFSGGQMVVNAGTKTKLVYTPQADKEFDFVLIHASYSDGTPNAYINNFNSNNVELSHLQYIRDSNKLQVFSADWRRSTDTNFTFSGDPALYGIYADSGTYAFAIQKNCYESQELFEKLGSYDAVDFGSDKVEFVFEGSGTVRIDYIGFYKAQNSLVDTSRTAGQLPAQAITRGGKDYTLVSTLFGEGNNGISLTDYLGAEYIEAGSLLKITQQDTSTEETMDLPANGANVSYIELRVKLSSASASPHLGLTWQAQFFRNNLGGHLGGGLACGIGAQTAINPTNGVYSLYGIALSETAGGELVFFFDGVEKASGVVNKPLQASVVKGQETYPFFYTFDGGSGAWFEIDYIAFYTDTQ